MRLDYERALNQKLSDDQANMEYYEKKAKEARAKYEATKREWQAYEEGVKEKLDLLA